MKFWAAVWHWHGIAISIAICCRRILTIKRLYSAHFRSTFYNELYIFFLNTIFLLLSFIWHFEQQFAGIRHWWNHYNYDNNSCSIQWSYMSIILIVSRMASIIVRLLMGIVRICACQRHASMSAVHAYPAPAPPVSSWWRTAWCVWKIVSTRFFVCSLDNWKGSH